MKVTQKQLRQLIKEEETKLLGEGMFTSAIKAIATPALPGGRMASDYLQARGFDELEEFMEVTQETLTDLGNRVAEIEDALEELLRRLGV